MLGYVITDKGELKVREYEIYTGYYCGICKYIGKTYGQAPRMALSYDAAFLAVFLAAADPSPDLPSQEHCAVHHIRKRTVIQNRAVEYAGDIMMILAWYKLRDDVDDDGSFAARAGTLLLHGARKKLEKKYPRLWNRVGELLREQEQLESEACSSIDQAAENSAQIMAEVCREGIRRLYGPEDPDGDGRADGPEDPENYARLHETFAKAGYHLGKWIYLIDAADDIEENLESGTYNPLLLRYGYDAGKETPARFRERIDEPLRFNLYASLSVIGETVDSLEFRKNSGIIENVVYFGLNRRTDEVLKRIDPGRKRHP